MRADCTNGVSEADTQAGLPLGVVGPIASHSCGGPTFPAGCPTHREECLWSHIQSVAPGKSCGTWGHDDISTICYQEARFGRLRDRDRWEGPR